jgi:signal transduction histidine kinase
MMIGGSKQVIRSLEVAEPARFAMGSEMVSLRVRGRVYRWLTALLISMMAVAAFTALVLVLYPTVPASSALVLYLLVIVPAAIVWDTKIAVTVAVLSAVVYDYFLTPPVYSLWPLTPQDYVALSTFLITAIVTGELAARTRRAARESARLVDEQSALLRVAAEAVQSVSPLPLFQAVTREVGLLCGADLTRTARYEEDGSVTGVAVWSRVGDAQTVGVRATLDGPSIAQEVWRTGAPVRIGGGAGARTIASEARELGICSSVGCPIVVRGRLWGVISASKTSDEPFPATTEAQIARFTELVATAILTSAETRAELAASRTRVVTAADEVRRRLGRDLHDGAQQLLVSLALGLRVAQETVPTELSELRDQLSDAVDRLGEALQQLRELSQGLYPVMLSDGGLGPALRSLARHCAIPVELHADTLSRYERQLEVSAYYVVSEALTNAIKHARATRVAVTVDERDGVVQLCIGDDGVGGADMGRGSGLIGLRDRVEALGGRIDVTSPVGHGTMIEVSLPIAQQDGRVIEFPSQSAG